MGMRGSSSAALLVAAVALGLAALGAHPAASADVAHGTRAATLLQIEGAIGPATARYFVRGLEAAEAAGSVLVILQLDTPGRP